MHCLLVHVFSALVADQKGELQLKAGEQPPFSLMLQQGTTSFLAPGAPFEVPVLFQVSAGSELARVADKERIVEALAVLVLRKLDGKFFTYCNDTSPAQYASLYA